MKRVMQCVILVAMQVLCFAFSGCMHNTTNGESNDSNRPNLTDLLDYTDWYCDIDNTTDYNYVKWIELDIWFAERINVYDWTDTTFEVTYEGNTIATDIPVLIVDINYMKCYFDINNEGAVVTENGYLAPGLYEISLIDHEGNTIVSSTCTVTAYSGEALSQMITNVSLLDSKDKQTSIQIDFNDDITPFYNTGFYVSATQNGETLCVPVQYNVELAKTYMIVNCNITKDEVGEFLLTVYCGDGTKICEKAIKYDD